MIKRRDFSTLLLNPEDRAGAWRDYMAETFFRLDIETKGADHEHGTLQTAQLPGFGITHYDIATQELMTRRKQIAAHDQVEDILFIFPLHGRFEFSQRGNTGLLVDGGAYCLNSSDGYRCFVSEHPQSLTLKVPLSSIRERISWIENCSARSDIANPELVPLVRQFCADLAKVYSPETMPRLQSVLFDLLALMVEGGNKTYKGERIPPSMKDALWTQIEMYVKRNFARHDLSIVHAAKTFGVSVRYIQKVLSEHDTTFQQMLMDRRLDEARRLISEPGKAQNLQIGQVAYLSGFTSQAHFATRFRSRFGLSPRDQRRLALIDSLAG